MADNDEQNTSKKRKLSEQGVTEKSKKSSKSSSSKSSTKSSSKSSTTSKKASKAPSKSTSKTLKKSTSKSSKTSSTSVSSAKPSKDPALDKNPKVKTLSKLERLEEARKAFKWWETKPLPEGINWRSLEHPGVFFAAPYAQHHIPLLYDGQRVELNAEQEELASFFALIPLDGPQLGNPTVRKVFTDNFFQGFSEAFPADSVVKEFNKCDFSLIRDHLNMKKSLLKAATGEEKEAKKLDKEQVVLQYAYGLVDGRLEKVG